MAEDRMKKHHDNSLKGHTFVEEQLALLYGNKKTKDKTR